MTYALTVIGSELARPSPAVNIVRHGGGIATDQDSQPAIRRRLGGRESDDRMCNLYYADLWIMPTSAQNCL